jgi:hypothetical protein
LRKRRSREELRTQRRPFCGILSLHFLRSLRNKVERGYYYCTLRTTWYIYYTHTLSDKELRSINRCGIPLVGCIHMTISRLHSSILYADRCD